MYAVEYRRAARKALLKMPRDTARRFLAAFEQLAAGKGRGDLDVKPMMGRDGYRLRIGDWRAIYRIEDDRLLILVIHIGPRGDVYK